MHKGIYTIESNEALTENVFKMTLSGDTTAITSPGQFVNISLNGFYLRRPISVCDVNGNSLTLIYKTVGSGTEKMSQLEIGEKLDLLVGLGNGFNTELSGQNPLLIGGGVGAPPLFLLAKRLIAEGKNPKVILGFNTKNEIFLKNEFQKLGVDVYITIADGSAEIKGFVTNALSEVKNYDYIYACGPEAMLKSIYITTQTDGQFSFEQRMACGFGACMGCTCETKYGYKRICREGPVLTREEIIW